MPLKDFLSPIIHNSFLSVNDDDIKCILFSIKLFLLWGESCRILWCSSQQVNIYTQICIPSGPNKSLSSGL